MGVFLAKDEQFWLDDRSVLVQAGEFHYFRTPKDKWEHRLGLLKEAGFNAVASYIPWLWHEVEEGVFDFDGHTHPMRDLEGFLDLCAQMGFLIMARPGPYIMAETINEGIPQWVLKNYPQVAFISQDEKVQNIISYLHPDFLARVRAWYKGIFSVLTPRQVSHGGKIIMVQLDNEMGMMAWVRNIIDSNPDTLTRMAEYLRKTYGASTRYPDGNLPEFLHNGIVNPSDPYASLIVSDYRRFYRDYLREYTEFLWSEARSCGMDVMAVINIHGFANGGKPFPIGLSQLLEVMRIPGMISATDVYPGFINVGSFHELVLVNEMTKALQNNEQPLFSIEFQAGGNHDFGCGDPSLYDLHSRLVLSVGMRAINHYLFVSGENDPLLSPVKRHDWGHPVRQDGSLRQHYYRYPKLSSVLNAYGEALTLSRPETVTTIGFILDYFMTEVNNSFTQESTNILTHQRGQVLFDFQAKGLSVTHRPYNAIDLANGSLDPTRIPTLWVMMEKQCSPEIQQKLVDYVHAGGKLVLAGRMCAEDHYHNPCEVLKDALGIQEIQTDISWTVRDIQVFQHRNVPVSFLETYSGNFDEIFARSENGEPAGFVKHAGQGVVLVFGAAMTACTLDDIAIVDEMAARLGCEPLFKMDNWLDTRISRGEKGSFLFLNNYQHDPVETTIEYKGQVLFGGHAVKLPARRGLILPLDWHVSPGIRIHYSTAEILDVAKEGDTVTIKTEPLEFHAQITLNGYSCSGSWREESLADGKRLTIHKNDGTIVLRRE